MARRRYTENAELILSISDFMRSKSQYLHPGHTFFDVLPSGYNVWTECKEDGIHLFIGTDTSIVRTYKLDFDPIPQNPNQRCQYIRWALVDSTGHRVLYIFQIDNEIGSRHELRLFRKSNSEAAARRRARRKRNWKHAPDLLEFSKPIMRVVREKPWHRPLFSWMREVVTARFGGYIYRDIRQQFEEALTMAENEYQTIMNIRRRKYRNLEKINARRHQEKIERQRRAAEELDEPIVGFKT
jgi:hypothetical protein